MTATASSETIDGVFQEVVLRQPHRLAVALGSHRLTYRCLAEAVCACHAELEAAGVRAGDRVGIQLGRTLEYVVSYMAIMLAGASVVPFDLDASDEAVALEVERLRLRLLITARRLRGVPRGMLLQIDPTRPRGPVSRWSSARRKDLHRLSEGSSKPESLATFLSTSGTTGTPRRVMHTHRALLANAQAHRLSIGAEIGEISLIALPLQYGYCNTTQLVGQLCFGGTVVLQSGTFLPSAWCRLVESHMVTTSTLVPPMLELLVRFSSFDEFDMSSLRNVVFGGAVARPEVLDALATALPHVELIETYGQTEAGPRLTTRRATDTPKSVGRPIAGVTLRVAATASGGHGEVLARSPGTMAGYFRESAATAKKLRDGWLHTGDVGWVDESGCLNLVGRVDRQIISGGHTFSAEEIETTLARSSVVIGAAVVALPDRLRGHVVGALISSDCDEAVASYEVRSSARSLPSYKRPRVIRVVGQLPRTSTGKVDLTAVSRLLSQ